MFEFEIEGFEMNKIGKKRCLEAESFNLNLKGCKMNKIGKRRCLEAESFHLNLKGCKMNKIGKWMCGEAKKIEFEFEGLEINKIGKSRCEEEKDASQAQRSGPLLLVCNKEDCFGLEDFSRFFKANLTLLRVGNSGHTETECSKSFHLSY